jgi:stage II sporulation protein AA (anti-sigma F factor antagonist)
MDSSGLGLIMGRYTLMQKMGGEFCVRNPNERIVKIFRLAGLERMVRVESEGKEALK